ncbi:hypothetical protein DGo_PF0044 (plasmid) [Deinococcus gobiensis I-0]|uniref:Uncharacterized protein n=1 Tax=Deinococcus gobiensis (strain DSM 21396 / JCM 16679 / CGMCC 1.7299 / I-0) TaxID=745776 RepID=H8H420_DEIGI|nr:hypothetical protein DGo_PF0044 [Deinococcus gobiensis I-0]
MALGFAKLKRHTVPDLIPRSDMQNIPTTVLVVQEHQDQCQLMPSPIEPVPGPTHRAREDDLTTAALIRAVAAFWSAARLLHGQGAETTLYRVE